jgi:hypothetical protein
MKTRLYPILGKSNIFKHKNKNKNMFWTLPPNPPILLALAFAAWHVPSPP